MTVDPCRTYLYSIRHDSPCSTSYDFTFGCRFPPYNLKSVSRLITLIVSVEPVRLFSSVRTAEEEEKGTIFAFLFLNIFLIAYFFSRFDFEMKNSRVCVCVCVCVILLEQYFRFFFECFRFLECPLRNGIFFDSILFFLFSYSNYILLFQLCVPIPIPIPISLFLCVLRNDSLWNDGCMMIS